MSIATVFAPGSIGNVGPGFDVLGLAVEGIGDRVTVELSDGPARVAEVTGRDAELVPRDPARNVASIAAAAWLRNAGIAKQAVVSIQKGLPLAGGLGGSAASSVGGALAACLAAGHRADQNAIIAAALEGESAVAGRHLDNIGACVTGGLALCRSVDPIDVIGIPIAAPWSIVLLSPRVRIETKQSRSILPRAWENALWIQQMANTSALVHAFATGDAELLRRSLDDRFAEPVRAPLIPNFFEVKKAALEAGALGCSISGGGPTIFAIVAEGAHACAAAMKAAMLDIDSDVQIAPIAREGARRA
ncbi:MAG: homoserine kinase [Thermoanaerobaculia bacterium]